MGRRKKEEDKKVDEGKSLLGPEAKRGIGAICLFTVAIIFFLGFIGQAGVFGDTLDTWLGIALGWSRWLLPPLFSLVGVMLFRHRETTFQDSIKYIALSIAYVAVLGLSHLFLGDTNKELKAVALDGMGGRATRLLACCRTQWRDG